MAGTGKSKYLVIKEQIENKILKGEYLPGSLLPSEPALTDIYKASRGTIRNALSALEHDGMVARRSGLGTTVLRRTKEARLLSFSEQVQLMKKTPSTRLLGKACLAARDAGGRAAEAFILDPKQTADVQVYRIERLRLADQIPVSLQVVILSIADFGLRMLDEENFTESAFAFYERQGRHPTWASEIIKARHANPNEIKILALDSLPSSDFLVYERDRITYDNENMPLEVLRSIDRVDFFGGYCYRLSSERQVKGLE